MHVFSAPSSKRFTTLPWHPLPGRSARGEVWVSSQVLLSICISVHACGPLDSQSHVRAFQSPYEHCIPKGNDNLLQNSCLENSTDRGVWRAIVHGVAKSWTWLSVHAHTQSSFEVFHTLSFTLTGIGTSESCDVKQLPLILPTTISQDRVFLTYWALSQINKDKLNRAFPGSCQTGRVTIFLVAPNPFCPLLWLLLGCWFSQLSWLPASSFQGYYGTEGSR